MKTIHYQHPVLNYHACGMGDSIAVQMSADINEVTCKRCLFTVTGQKRAPGRPLKGSEPTQKISVRLPKSLIEWLDSLEGDRTSNLTQIVSNAKNS